MVMKALFGSSKPKEEPKPPQLTNEQMKEMQREFKKKLNKEIREIEKQIYNIEQLKKKSEESLTKELKKPKPDNFIKQTYGKQIVQSNKNKERVMVNKYKVQNVLYSLDTMFANIKMAQIMGASADLMKNINQCMKVKELNSTMTELQKEMMQFGLVQEMIDDTMDQMADPEMSSLDSEQEINQIIREHEEKLQNKNVNAMNAPIANQDQNFEDMEKNLAKLLE